MARVLLNAVFGLAPLAAGIAVHAFLCAVGIPGSVDEAFFTTVAQVVPVVALAAAVEAFGGGRRASETLFTVLSVNLVCAEVLALWGAATLAGARWAALAIGAYLLVQLFLLGEVARIVTAKGGPAKH